MLPAGDPADEPVTGAPAGAAGGPAGASSPSGPDDVSYQPGSATVSGPAGQRNRADQRGPADQRDPSDQGDPDQREPARTATATADPDSPAGPAGSARRTGRASAPPGASASGGAGRGTRTGGLLGWLRSPRKDSAGPARAGTPGTWTSEETVRLRRRRRWFITGIAAGAALIVIALCAGTVAVVGAVGGFRDSTDDAREARELRASECLSLEQRLNRLVPPGSATTPQARAVAVRDENAAVRIYVDQLRDNRAQDGWRQLLDARTTYAEALDLQAKSRTPAFYVPPRAPDGVAVTDELVDSSPASCAGAVRRLAVPDL